MIKAEGCFLKLNTSMKGLLLIVYLFNLTACSTVSFYTQGVVGHSKLMLARKPVDKVLKNANEPLATQLLLSKELKKFAITELSLPDSKSYNTYVTLKREFPVWVVVATSEFSITPKRWCYPVIGCAAYRGYFKQSSAIDYSQSLVDQGFEVSVGGAPAYSTLGWFADLSLIHI